VQVDLWELIAEELKTITGALAVSVSTYDPTDGELEVRYIAVQGQILSQASKLLGHKLVGMRMPVPPEMLRRMLSEVVPDAQADPRHFRVIDEGGRLAPRL
jgi:hypothetical protein